MDDGLEDGYDYVVHMGYPKDGSPNVRIAILASSILERSNGDPGVFGMMAADFIEHCAKAAEGMVALDGELVSRDQILTRIKDVLLEELQDPPKHWVTQ